MKLDPEDLLTAVGEVIDYVRNEAKRGALTRLDLDKARSDRDAYFKHLEAAMADLASAREELSEAQARIAELAHENENLRAMLSPRVPAADTVEEVRA